MAKSKKAVQKHAPHEMIDVQTQGLLPSDTSKKIHSARSMSGKWYIVILILLLLGFFLMKKGYIVAAVVNSKPIFRWDVNRVMMNRFGTQTLETMITEQLISDAAEKEGIVVSREEIDGKVAGIMTTLGPNVKLEELLKYQGMTKEDFEQQVRLQLTVEKVLGKGVVVEDKDISAFIEANGKTMEATEEAAMREEARQTLMSQKISEKIQPWLTGLKEKAKVMKFL